MHENGISRKKKLTKSIFNRWGMLMHIILVKSTSHVTE